MLCCQYYRDNGGVHIELVREIKQPSLITILHGESVFLTF